MGIDQRLHAKAGRPTLAATLALLASCGETAKPQEPSVDPHRFTVTSLPDTTVLKTFNANGLKAAQFLGFINDDRKRIPDLQKVS